jgi:hypothetical protein
LKRIAWTRPSHSGARFVNPVPPLLEPSGKKRGERRRAGVYACSRGVVKETRPAKAQSAAQSLLWCNIAGEMTDHPARPPVDWSGAAPFPFTRESSIRIDKEGRFWHEGALVDHPKLALAMASWISRHPHDGRWVLDNGYDWCWITVEDTPFLVRAARVDGVMLVVTLSDGSEERLDPHALHVDAEGNLRCEVKHAARGGPYPAKFDRLALQSLGERMREDPDRRDGWILRLEGTEVRLSPAAP